jgi:prepilin-type N-terminal cleavage/methylation domain-containing protein
MKTRPRGFTLLEQMVVVALLALLIGLAVTVLQPCLVEWGIVQDRSDMERSSTLAGERIRREWLSSTKASLTVLASPPAFSFLVPADAVGSAYDPLNGTPMWDHYVIYFLDATHHILFRKLWPAPVGDVPVPPLGETLPSTTAHPLSAAELALVCSTSNGTERPVATLVDGIAVSTDAAAVVLEMQLSVQTRRGVDHLTRRLAVHMRNP